MDHFENDFATSKEGKSEFCYRVLVDRKTGTTYDGRIWSETAESASKQIYSTTGMQVLAIWPVGSITPETKQIPASSPLEKTFPPKRIKFLMGFLVLALGGLGIVLLFTLPENEPSPYAQGRQDSQQEITAQAAEQGNAEAQYQLGLNLWYGVTGITQQDRAEAVRWHRLAAEQGHARAQFSLGNKYWLGIHFKQNNVEAARWYRLAAEQGHAEAQHRLAQLYRSGKGVQRDRAEAVRWYRLAAEQGHAAAQFALGYEIYTQDVLMAYTQDSIRDATLRDSEAIRWFRLAADQGLAGAQLAMGMAYDKDGMGTHQEDAEAAKWYRLAAAQGVAEAQEKLNIMIRSGRAQAAAREAAPAGADPLRPAWAAAVGSDQHGYWADLQVGQVTQRMRWIAPGSFQMGSPPTEDGRGEDETQHTVTLMRGFWLANTECTQALWWAVMGNNPSFMKDPTRPVESVNWEDCQAFLQRLNSQVRDLNARLPTEAEWEYACRAGSTGPYAGPNLADLGWFRDNTRLTFGSPVAQKRPNAWGLFDMHGNVSEWCADWYGAYPSGSQRDPTGPASGSDRVHRGGSWTDTAQRCRSANRGREGGGGHMPDSRYGSLGFRFCAPIQ